MTKQKKYSYAALQWLHYESLQRNVYIKHAQNGEEKIGPYWVDGFATEGNIIFSFLGCFWHGCPKWFNEDTVHPYYNISMGEVFKRTEKQRDFFLNVCTGYNYVDIWEHEWKLLKKSFISEMAAEIAKVPKDLELLNPREAFFGGRTNGVKLYHKVQGGEKILYVDFCSLYPFTNKYCSYPVGHPQVLTCDLSFDMSLYYGVARVQILPPRTLFHPVLPVKANDKLIFPLCNTCAHSKLTDRCNRSDSERALTGTWVTLELEKAVKMGYKILKVDIVWNFTERSLYNKDT